MIQINELKITSDNKYLILDVQIKDQEYLQNVIINTISIDTQNTWSPSGPSEDSMVLYTQENKELDSANYDGKRVYIKVSAPFIDTSKNNMYFVYVTADISNAPEITQSPCQEQNDTIIGIAINQRFLYNHLMSSIKELNNDCTDNKNFIQSFLELIAIDSSIKTANYPIAIKYWNKFFNKNIEFKHNNCGCNGKSY